MIKRLYSAVLKRLPSHATARAQDLLLPRRDFERLRLPGASALTVSCDDGELKDLDIVEVLEKHGVKGVFAVSPDLIGKPGFLSYAQLRQIRDAGHEIAFHGTTHDPFTGFATTQALLQACRDGLAQLESQGLGRPTTLIYPYGSHDRAVRAAMAGLFDAAFTTWFGLNRHTTNRYAIRRIPFGAYTGKLPASQAWYHRLVDAGARGHAWPTLMLHPSAQEHTREHTAWLDRLVQHALDRGMPVRTAAAHLRSAMAPAAASSPEAAPPGRA